ncbi:ABC transporter substrate-binding protein [Paenibacillus kobensis]|uniref:ABC transporter substrate-binding protein n=1 Tax=Paenibacillus kobensis TaxID=59841 RepID=UPI0013E2AB0D|nr:ABC transporter substrate-binding protein [Paenibacillus kobensis]
MRGRRNRHGSGAGGWRRHAALWLSAFMLTLVLAGCSEDRQKVSAQVHLKVLDSSEQGFYQMYGDYVTAAFPNVEVEVIPSGMNNYQLSFKDRLQKFKSLILTEQPDLIMLSDNDMYHALADDGLFSELSVHLAAEPELEKHIQPGVLEQMRNARRGGLYGLSADFSAQLLYYNQDLFDSVGVDPPKDGMTWAEMLKLAQRVTQAGTEAEGTIGFLPDFPGPSGLASLIAMTEGLGIFPYRASTGMMLADTPSWRQIFKTALEAYDADVFRTKGAADGEVGQPIASSGGNGQDWFAKGLAGMVIAKYGSYGDVPFKLGAVSPPVDEATRMRSFGIGSPFTMSIRAGSPLTQESWDIIAFMMSDYVAKVSAELGVGYNGFFPSNVTYADYSSDPFVASVYRQMPSLVPDEKSFSLSKEAYGEMNELVRREMNEALAGNQTLDELIERMQTKGQKILEWGIRNKKSQQVQDVYWNEE